jgi:hypothetical protein
MDLNWWDDDSHPDAEAHRKFLENGNALPPATTWQTRNDALGLEEIGAAVGATMRPIIEKLEARVAMLEQGLARHAGSWRAGRSYAAGEFCTRSGSLWHCRKDFASGAPGESPDWKLVVKKGDAK